MQSLKKSMRGHRYKYPFGLSYPVSLKEMPPPPVSPKWKPGGRGFLPNWRHCVLSLRSRSKQATLVPMTPRSPIQDGRH